MKPSFRRQMLAYCLAAALLPSLVVGSPLAAKLSALLQEDAAERAALLAQRTAERLDRSLQLAANRAVAVARDSDVRRAGRVPIFISKTDTILRSYLRDSRAVAALYYLDAAGDPITAAPAGAELTLPAGAKALLRDLARAPSTPPSLFRVVARGQGEASVSDGPFLAVLVPVLIGADTVGTLVAILPWLRLLGEVQAGEATAQLNRIAVRAGKPGVDAAASLPLATRDLGPSAGLDGGSYEATALLLASGGLDSVSGGPFELVLSAPAGKVFRTAHQAQIMLWALAAGSAILLGLVALGLARRLIKPLDELHAFVGAYAAGDFAAPPPILPQSELDDISRLLKQMGDAVVADRAARERLAEAQKAQLVAELGALKNQLKPHFLFNALNSIAAIAHDDGPAAVPMLSKLASLYRLILATSERATQPLSAELEIVRNYLDLEGLRLRERLTYRIEQGGVSDALPVPCLLLQTLVENCIKHGIAPSLTGGHVALTLAPAADGRVLVDLRNSGEPLAPAPRFGTGLTNTFRRLTLLTGGAPDFTLTRGAAGETVVRFTLKGDA